MNLGQGQFSKNVFSQPGAGGESGEEGAPKRPHNVNAAKPFFDLKKRLHTRLVQELDLSKMGLNIDKQIDKVKEQIINLFEDLIKEENVPIGLKEKKNLLDELIDDILGLGPLEGLLKDPAVNDILVNGPKQVYVERKGVLELTPITFDSEEHLMLVIRRITSKVGRRVDESSPMVDCRLPDGSRVNSIILPLAIDGASLSIRKFSKKKLSLEDLIKYNAITEQMYEVLQLCVRCRMNILVSGGTGSGKTTFLNALSNFISDTERTVTIEDAAELQIQSQHVVRLETRPPNLEGKGEVSQRDLVKNALRMRPERIILGEIRSGEALDLLQAMNTGHDGSMGTLHANTTRDAFARLETMCLMSGIDLPQRAIREQIASAVHLICQLNRFHDGSRRITAITEITGMEGEKITSQDIFSFQQQGVDENGKVKGVFKTGGIKPLCAKKIETMGYKFPQGVFGPY